MYFVVPETKGVPLEEMGLIFGDDVAVYAQDLHVDHNTHELFVNKHGDQSHQLERVASEVDIEKRITDVSKHEANSRSVEHVNNVDTISE